MEMKFKTAADYVINAGTTDFLFANIWEENTTALIHSPRETDKSATAVDIALSLTASGRTVFYVTTQRLSAALRSRIAGNTRLYVHTPRYLNPEDKTDFADIVIADIEEAIAATPARIFIIDSVSRIAALSFGRNASAAYVMKRLVALQVRYGISLLVLAHDSTRAADRALANLADSVIPISDPADEPVAPAPDESDLSDQSDPSDLSDLSASPGQPEPLPRRQLSRRDRRLLRRQAKKLKNKR